MGGFVRPKRPAPRPEPKPETVDVRKPEIVPPKPKAVGRQRFGCEIICREPSPF